MDDLNHSLVDQMAANLLRRRRDSSMILIRLVSKNKWDVVRKFLSTSGGKDALSKHKPDPGTNDSFLHILCMHNPPSDVVALVLNENPMATWAVNTMDRTPLHTAAIHGASAEVMKLLIDFCPQAAAMTDSKGRTPLILACGGAADELKKGAGAFRKSGQEKRMSGVSMVRIVKMLGEKAPETVGHEDQDGVDATEYSLLNEMHFSVFKMLRKQMEISLDKERRAIRSAAA